MLCSKCSTNNKDGAKFCAKCGEALSSGELVQKKPDTDADTVLSEYKCCQSCGSNNKTGAKFCSACGVSFMDNQSEIQPQGDVIKSDVKANKQIADKQIADKNNTLRKRVVLASVIVASFVLAAFAFYMIISIMIGPKNMVKGYFKAKTEENWERMYSYFVLDETDFINIDHFSSMMEKKEKENIKNFKVSKSSDSGIIKTYDITYRIAGKSSEQRETVSVKKKGQKKLLLFDDYIINADDLTVSDYCIRVPKNSIVKVDDTVLKQPNEVMEDSEDEDVNVPMDALYDEYVIPEIFSGLYNLSVEHTDFETYSEQVTISENNEELIVTNQKLNDTVRAEIAKKTEETYKQLLSSALDGKAFDELNLTCAHSDNLAVDIIQQYERLILSMRDNDKAKYNSIDVTKFTDNSKEGLGVTYTCEMEIEYKYETGSKKKSSANDVISFEYIYENGEWVLLKLLRLGSMSEDGTSTKDEESESPQKDEDGDENDRSKDDDYILPFSSTREVTAADLQDLSREELRIARNEIYARYGRQFKDAALQEYFNGKSWYAELEKLPEGVEPTLTKLEIRNAEFIQIFEDQGDV